MYVKLYIFRFSAANSNNKIHIIDGEAAIHVYTQALVPGGTPSILDVSFKNEYKNKTK